MDQSMTLPKFLSANTSTTQFTHTGLKGGKYWIPEDKQDQFYDLYAEWLLDGKLVHLVEKNTKIGSLRIDFDFIYDPAVKTHQHTQQQVLEFTKAYMKEVSEYLVIPENVDDLVKNLNEYRKTIKGDFEEKVETLNEFTKGLIEKKES